MHIPGGVFLWGCLFFLLDEWKLAALLAVGRGEKFPRKP
jgi:hypothetical protein